MQQKSVPFIEPSAYQEDKYLPFLLTRNPTYTAHWGKPGDH